MNFYDIVFPLNIPPLTYAVPDRFLSAVKPGMALKAEVGKSFRYGILLKRASEPPRSPAKEILQLVTDKPVFSSSLLKLISWLSEYYYAHEGIALKCILPDDVFNSPKARKNRRPLSVKKTPPMNFIPETSPSPVILKALSQTGYKTHLLPVPTRNHEISLLISLLPHLRNTIILVPEIADIDLIMSCIPEHFCNRISTLHGRLSKTGRIDAFHKIQTGASDIVIGTRIAVFAPLGSVSLIMVLQEQSRSYKNLEGLRYHARDVAVKRGSLDNAPVLLSSHCPSVESFHNASRGKYTIIPAEMPCEKPKVEIINMNTSKKIAAYLSAKTVTAARTVIRDKGFILFLINRKGFSILQCAECGHSECCPDCTIPFVYHKEDNILKCHYCGRKTCVPVLCTKCRGTRIEMMGAGTQRIASDIEKHLGMAPLRLDTDIVGKRAIRRESALPGMSTITVGTNIVFSRFHDKSFDVCASLNPDAGLRLPDFRSAEHLYQELLTASHLVKQKGIFFIQTRMPQHYVYQAIKRGDFPSFYREDILMRRSLSYPPFSRMAVVTITSRNDSVTLDEIMVKNTGKGLECIGPLKSLKRGAAVMQYLIKSSSPESFRSMIHDVAAVYRGKKGVKVTVDIDPI